MKTLLLSATYLVGIGELILAMFFWATHSKSEIRKVMALLAFSTGMWVITTALTSYVEQTSPTAFYMKIVFASGALLVTALLHLSLVYPYPFVRLDRLHGWLIYFPTILWSVISFSSNAIILSFTGSATDSGRIIPGSLYSLYSMYVFGVYSSALIIFLIRKQKTEGQHKRNLSLIAWSVLVGGFPAVAIDLLIPVFTWGIYPNALVGPLCTIVWLGTMAKIITSNE